MGSAYKRNNTDNVYVADFETRAGENAIAEEKTWVWAWACTKITNFDDVEVGNSIKSFFRYVNTLKSCTIYFHNLKFDGRFIIDFLLKAGYTWCDSRKKDKGTFSTLISDTGMFYNISIRSKRGFTVEFRDSLKKAAGSVESLGKSYNTKYRKTSIDYELDRPEDYEMTDDEKEYVKNDVRVIAEVISHFYAENLTALTIGSDALSDFMSRCGGKDKFRQIFPIIDAKEDMYARKAYRGGYCYNNKCGTWENVNGETYDVNSLYPSMMHSVSGNLYPVHEGVWYEGKFEPSELYPVAIQHLTVSMHLKPKHIPTVMLKGSVFQKNIQYVTECQNQELYLTNVDVDLMLKHYIIDEIEYHDGYKYNGRAGLFDEYIDHWSEIKKNNKGAKRAIAKLFLNSLYGKFSTRVKVRSKQPLLNEEKGKVDYVAMEADDKDPVFAPVGTFVTSYARRFTITAAQENYDNFIYADTDSLHMIGKAKGITVHPKNLCAWKNEASWDTGIFLRQKTYIEHVTHEDGEAIEKPFYNVKCAGMDEKTKQYFLKNHDVHDFKYGLLIEGTKLLPKTVNGGCILVPVPYQLKP